MTPFLAQHRATLVRDEDGWLLRYPLERRSFCEERRFNLPIETAIALAGETRENLLRSFCCGAISRPSALR
jgi:hypothetical protein